MSEDTSAALAALAAWDLVPERVERFGKGLINDTWLVRAGEQRFVLQRVSGIFPVEVNEDIDVITRHVAAKGLVTLRLVPTTAAALWQSLEWDRILPTNRPKKHWHHWRVIVRVVCIML